MELFNTKGVCNTSISSVLKKFSSTLEKFCHEDAGDMNSYALSY